ncbi:hypothetical protein [Clostridium cadaveris]|uniref:Uncharacterized protein n=1 Tax=Clostridium cadaveris TaxID=1529 RepID=A0A316M843_9CLOT|nr:hypothetical protein [Clostridium cadaveris]PWL53205.1 MAG: hypothetical protein DBY38_08550 [Clostridium cadaveris]
MEKNLQIIRNYKDANKLMHLGHRCIGVAQDKNRYGYLVFFFAVSDKLIKDLENITEITKQEAREWHKIN